MTSKRFTTFEGVFTPCFLSILGVIIYLRLGWVVGSVGFAGALIIISLSHLITIATGLSISSIVTNIRIGAGGAYSIITKSLGIEAGGAIGIPLYISQAVSVAFYITGFSECWLFIFPGHNILFVSLVAWFILLIVSYTSAKLAFRIQYVIMVLIGISFISIFLGKGDPQNSFSFLEGFSRQNFWSVFAVFFPAVTGILAGASMSGELKDPKRSIPVGTLSAIIIGFFVYVLIAFWFAKQATLGDLRMKAAIALDIGRWRWAVIAGIMGATISSAMAMFVGAPRVLLALGKHSIVPFSSDFSRLNKRGEPAAAILFTALIVLITILAGTLNQIASLLTLFFLITYGMINITVFIEQTIGIASFRPTFRVNQMIPLVGSIGCLLVMFLINFKFSLIAILVIVAIYWILLKREARIYAPDIRSGILSFIAEELAKVASRLPYYPKIWKPNLIVPVADTERFKSIIGFIRAVIAPAGRAAFFKIYLADGKNKKDIGSNKDSIKEKLLETVEPLKEEGMFVEATVAEAPDLLTGSTIVMQALKGLLFPPNTLFYLLEEDCAEDAVAGNIIKKAALEDLGIIVLSCFKDVGFGGEQVINLWIRKQSPNINLAILIALQVKSNWESRLRLVQVVSNNEDIESARSYLIKLKEIMRMPLDVEIEILAGDFNEFLKKAPPADLNIFGMQEEPDISMVRVFSDKIQTSVLFLKDSKYESALA